MAINDGESNISLNCAGLSEYDLVFKDCSPIRIYTVVKNLCDPCMEERVV